MSGLRGKFSGLGLDTGPDFGLDAREFFEAVGSRDDSKALDLIKNSTFLDPELKQPSPRGEEFVGTSEWDEGNVGLVLVVGGTCKGRVGGFNGPERFCGRPACEIAGHQRAMVDVKEGYWYIQAGTRSNTGYLSEPSLPSHRLEGPVVYAAERRLLDPDGVNPFRMNIGQWKFVFNEWIVSQVESFESGSGGESLPGSGAAPGTSTAFGTATSGLPPSHGAAAEDEPTTGSKPFVVGGNPKPGSPAAGVQYLLDEIHALREDHERLRADTQMIVGQFEGVVGRLRNLERKVGGIEQAQGGLGDTNARLTRLAFDVTDPRGSFARLENELEALGRKVDGGGGIKVNGGFTFSSDLDLKEWFGNNQAKIVMFADAVAILHSIQQTVVHTSEATKAQEAARKIDLTTSLEASIRGSFNTMLPSVLVGGKKDLTGGPYECLIGYMKTFSVWHPRGPQASSGVRVHIRDGAKTVRRRIQLLRDTLTTNLEVRELSATLVQESDAFIHEFIEFVNDQYEELTTNSTFTEAATWSLIVDCMAHIFKELHEARSAYVDAGQHDESQFLWGFLKAHKVQQRYRGNNFKDDPALSGILVRRILVHDGEQSVKQQLAALKDTVKEVNDLQEKVKAQASTIGSLKNRVQALEKGAKA